MTVLPKISVITPCLNGAKYLEEAIQSVLAQGYPNFEHIVVDGGSTDGTLDILKKHPHIKWVSEPDEGQSDAMNKGFAMSTGDIIVYLNADDYFEPGAFRTAVSYLDKEQGIYFVVGDCGIVRAEGGSVEINVPVTSLFEMLQWWKYSFPRNPASYFCYREVYDKVGLFDIANHYAMDYDFLLRASARYQLLKINHQLGVFRMVPGTKTHMSSSEVSPDSYKYFARRYWRLLKPGQRARVWLSWCGYRLARPRQAARALAGFPFRMIKRGWRMSRSEQ